MGTKYVTISTVMIMISIFKHLGVGFKLVTFKIVTNKIIAKYALLFLSIKKYSKISGA